MQVPDENNPPPSPTKKGIDTSCCTADDILNGKKDIVKKYEHYRTNLRKLGINAKKGWRAYFCQNEGASCSEQNEPIIDFIKPIPKCWECKLLNGSMFPFGIADHWWVECKGFIKGRMIAEFSLDAFFNKEGAGETETNRKKYPYNL